MIPLALAFAIFVSHLLALVSADSDNYFVYPPANPNFSSYAPNVTFGTFEEGASITLQWVTTWDSVEIQLSQSNNPIPLDLPNSQNISGTSSYTWIVDLSGEGGNPGFNLDRGQEFDFLLSQNGLGPAGLGGQTVWSEWFTITKSASSSSSSTASASSTTTLATSSSTASTSASKNMASPLKGLSKGAQIGITISVLAAIFGVGA